MTSANKTGQPSKADYLTLIRKNPEGMAVLSASGVILFLNPAAESLLGLETDKVMGKPIGFPFQLEQNTELKIILPDLQEKIVDLRVTDITWQEEPAFLLSLRDITDIKQIDRLRHEIEERWHVCQIKEAFVRTVAHDLRTPLAVIKEAAESLKDGIDGVLSDDQVYIADIASRNADRMASIISHLRNLSHQESAKPTFHIMPMDLAGLIEKTLNLFEHDTANHHLVWEKEIPVSMPTIYAEEDLLTEVLESLFKNAPRYCSKKILIRAKLAQQKEPIVLNQNLQDAKDKGPSKKADPSAINGFIEMSVICDGEPHQAHKASGSSLSDKSDAQEPFGLGPIKDTVEKHDGKIWVDHESSLHFHLILPVYQAGLRH